MALLSKADREKRFKYLGYDGYNKDNILKFQKKAFPNNKSQQDGKYGINTDRALRHFYNVKKCAPSFEPTEFRCNCGHCTGYPSYMKQVELKHLQKIRNHYDKPMKVTSGLRCEYENTKQGGVKNSGHLRGYATDFYMKGVTDTVENREKALKYFKSLPNHEFSYGAHMKDSNGLYRSADGMGNAMHTETHKPKQAVKKPTLADKIFDACKKQAEWMKNYKYGWRPHPTVPNSKDEGTCVTYEACVLQRLDYLESGKYIWHDEHGKVTHATKDMKVVYPKNKTLKQYKKYLKAGDIIMAGKASDVGAGSHVFIFAGKWSESGQPYIYDNHSAERVKRGKSAVHTYDADKKIIAVITLEEKR